MAKKISNDKNSLEQLLIRGKDGLAQNKAKAGQFLLVFVVVVVAIYGIRALISGGDSALTVADGVRATATEPKQLVAAAAGFKGETAAALYVDAGEAYLNVGTTEIARKKANSRAAENDPEAAALDPSVNFVEAGKAFAAAFGIGSAELKARAAYGAGAAQEALASVAADDAAVDAAVEAAKAQYAKVAELCASSPYCKVAAERLAALDRAVAADYLKATAKKFRELPTPPEKAESILTGDGELTPGETTNVGEFELNADEPATETTEEAATEATEEAPAE
ncbi:MAG: hypothetical protein IIW01_00930 [Thermoguttaceae bacterium]|nr:hypothetical protein [Thermoguttaceae bacterium]